VVGQVLVPVGEQIVPAADLAAYLLENAKIALVPGNVFGPGGEGYLRMSFANSYENVVEGCTQLKKAVALLQQKP